MFAVDGGTTDGHRRVHGRNTTWRPRACMAAVSTCCRSTLKLIQQGAMDFTIDQQPYLQGYYTVMEAYMYPRLGRPGRSGGHATPA